MEVSGQLQAPASLTPGYPLDRRLGGLRAYLDAVVKRNSVIQSTG